VSIRYILASLVLAAAFGCAAATPEWEQPGVVALNREPMKATFFNFESVEKAVAGDMAASQYYRSLDGTWSFAYTQGTDKRPVDFYKPGYGTSGWKTIQVPGMMQAQGYGRPIFTNIKYPFPANQPFIPHDLNEVGSYRRDFEVPGGWQERDVFLHIGAAGAAYYIWINGEKVGYSEDSKLPSEFNIGKFVRAGRNTIAIELYSWADGSYLEDQDFWRVSGIERSVYIYAEPKARLRDFTVTAALDKAHYRDGIFALEAAMAGQPASGSIVATIYDGARSVWSAAAPITAGRNAKPVPPAAGIPRCGRQAVVRHLAQDRLPHGGSCAGRGPRERQARDDQGHEPPRARPGYLPRNVAGIDAARHGADEARQHQRRAHLALPERPALVRTGRRIRHVRDGRSQYRVARIHAEG
jgi:hypothetical protein